MVATMTHNHDDTPYAIFNTICGICWKVSEFIDFDLKNRNSDLLACFSALIYDFSQLSKFYYQNRWKPGFKNMWKFIIYGLVKVRWVSYIVYKFIRLEILFLLTYHTQVKDIAVVKSETRKDFWSSCLYDTLNKLSPWHTFSNTAKIKSPWLTFSNMAKIRYYFL